MDITRDLCHQFNDVYLKDEIVCFDTTLASLAISMVLRDNIRAAVIFRKKDHLLDLNLST